MKRTVSTKCARKNAARRSLPPRERLVGPVLGSPPQAQAEALLKTIDWPTAKARAAEWAHELEAGEPLRRGALPLDALVDRFLRYQKSQVSRLWLGNQRHHLTEFVARCPAKDAADVRPAHVQAFLSTVAGSPATANRYRASLSRLFEWALTADLIASNPVRRVRMRREERRLPVYLSREDMDRLMGTVMGTELAVPVSLGLYAACAAARSARCGGRT